MIIGDPKNEWVTVDSAGVPSGGIFGDIDHYRKLLEARGMKIAWSWIWKAFFIYHMRGAVVVPLWLCWNYRRNRPEPITDGMVYFLAMCYEKFCRNSVKTIHKAAMEAQEEQKRKAAKELYQMRSDEIREATHRVGRLVGFSPKKIISIPSRVLTEN